MPPEGVRAASTILCDANDVGSKERGAHRARLRRAALARWTRAMWWAASRSCILAARAVVNSIPRSTANRCARASPRWRMVSLRDASYLMMGDLTGKLQTSLLRPPAPWCPREERRRKRDYQGPNALPRSRTRRSARRSSSAGTAGASPQYNRCRCSRAPTRGNLTCVRHGRRASWLLASIGRRIVADDDEQLLLLHRLQRVLRARLARRLRGPRAHDHRAEDPERRATAPGAPARPLRAGVLVDDEPRAHRWRPDVSRAHLALRQGQAEPAASAASRCISGTMHYEQMRRQAKAEKRRKSREAWNDARSETVAIQACRDSPRQKRRPPRQKRPRRPPSRLAPPPRRPKRRPSSPRPWPPRRRIVARPSLARSPASSTSGADRRSRGRGAAVRPKSDGPARPPCRVMRSISSIPTGRYRHEPA